MVYSCVCINIVADKYALQGVGEEQYEMYKEIVGVLRISHSTMN